MFEPIDGQSRDRGQGPDHDQDFDHQEPPTVGFRRCLSVFESLIVF